MPRAKISQQSGLTSVRFFCPGCKINHVIDVRKDGGHPSWTFNGDIERPTFTPSVLVRGTELTPKGWAEYERHCAAGFRPHDDMPLDHVDVVCHSFVTDGRIQFLGDCTHELAGQTVDLPELD